MPNLNCPNADEPSCEDCDDWGLIWCDDCGAHHPPQMPHGLSRRDGTECAKIWTSHGCCLPTDHTGECLCDCGNTPEPGRAEVDMCECGHPYRYPGCHANPHNK